MAQLNGTAVASSAIGRRPQRWLVPAMIAGVACALAVVFVQVSGSFPRGAAVAGPTRAGVDVQALQRHLAEEYASSSVGSTGQFVDRQRQLGIEYGSAASPLGTQVDLQRHLAIEYGSQGAAPGAASVDLQRHLAIEYGTSPAIDFITALRQHLQTEYGAP